MSNRDQMLSCSACAQAFIGEPEPVGIDFCSDDCRDEWWEEQWRKDQEAKKEEARSAENV